jgi:MFS family permease
MSAAGELLDRAETGNRTGMATFLLVWSGQLVSLLGSGLTRFALGVWVYQRAGSATDLGAVLLTAAVAAGICTPFAGALADRMDRRRLMIYADAALALVTLALLVLSQAGHLGLGGVLVLSSLGAVAEAFQAPALAAATVTLVPREHLGRAGGLLHLSASLSAVVCPLAAGLLIGVLGLDGLLLIDLLTFLAALLTLFAARFPQVASRGEGVPAWRSAWSDLREAVTFVARRPPLWGLVSFSSALNAVLAMVHIALTPLLLASGSSLLLGRVLSAGGIGMLVGSAVMSGWGGPRRRIRGICLFSLLASCGLLVTGATGSTAILAGGVLCFFACVPVVGGSIVVLWQRKASLDLQGRIAAFRTTLASLCGALTFAVSGPLLDEVLDPLARRGPEGLGWLGRLGLRPGSGAGLLFLGMAGALSLSAVALWAHPRTRHLERELPEERA